MDSLVFEDEVDERDEPGEVELKGLDARPVVGFMAFIGFVFGIDLDLKRDFTSTTRYGVRDYFDLLAPAWEVVGLDVLA